jgi:hypothetical protein
MVLALGEFPINRRHADLRDIYCKACCARKSREARRARGARAYRPRQLVLVDTPGGFLTVETIETVQRAISKGSRTRIAIQQSTRLSMETISDALAELAFNRNLLKSRRVGEDREFYLAGVRAA